MKKIIIFVLLFNHLFAQNDTTFVSLEGFLDSTNAVQLLLEQKYSSLSPYMNYEDQFVDSTVFIYTNLNVNESEYNLLTTGNKNIYYPENHGQYNRVVDVEFINRDPSKYIYSVNSLGIDPHGSIHRYDKDNVIEILGHFDGIHISSLNKNHLFAVSSSWISQSFDAGLTWSPFSIEIQRNPYIQFLAFSPFTDSIVFGCDSDKYLYKSNDTGKTFTRISEQQIWKGGTRLIFDINQTHIYALTSSANEYSFNKGYNNLFISENFGEENNWKKIYSSSSNINICLDDSISGDVFISIQNEVKKSTDYGESFFSLIKLNNIITGIYKAPNQNLFATLPRQLLEITADSIKILKQLSIDNTLNYYPLQVGNKWYYSEVGVTYDIKPNPINNLRVIEVTKDTLLNNLKYYCIEGTPYDYKFWVQVDSLEGKVYKYNSLNGEKRLLYNLLAECGDSLITTEGIITQIAYSDTMIWNDLKKKKTYFFSSLYTQNLTFVNGIGITHKFNTFDFGYTDESLLGCVIDGRIYGDTVLVNVENNFTDMPTKFFISQNYPNPFNPTTTISYTIPSKVISKKANVKLVVYDVLGQEIATLVNEFQGTGSYEVIFDASNLPSGIYYYSLQTNNNRITKKMILLK